MRRTCARRCAACGRDTRAPGRRTGGATTRTTHSSGRSSSEPSPTPTRTDLSTTPQLLDAFEVLYEAGGLPSYLLPFDLERIYGGIGFAPQTLYSNFVSSVDGVVALGEGHHAGSVISGKYAADRFLMALLRACADAVLLGAGTLRATPGHIWTAGHVYPQLADSFAGLRRSLGRSPEPRLVILTSSGDIEVSHTALKQGAMILTTAAGARALQGRVPAACDLRSVTDGDRLDIARVVEELRNDGSRVVLTEGGPHL